MTTSTTLARTEAWQAKLLCHRYSTARFDSVPIRADGVAGTVDFTVVWALGCLPDGTYDLLGSWPVVAADANSWIRVADDLGARGLERITHLVANESFFEATGGPGFLTGFGPFLPMPARRRRALLDLDGSARRLQRRLERSVARNGLFSGPQDAASFVARRLMRAENGLDAVETVTSPAKPFRSASRASDPHSVVFHG